MYERFTDRARAVVQWANHEAHYFNHEYIGTEHILLGLLQEDSGVAANVLRNLGLDLRNVRLEVEKIVRVGPYRRGRDKLPQTPRVKQAIAYAIEEADLLDHDYVGTEHLLLGLARGEESVASQVLLNLGLTLEQVRAETLPLLGREIPQEKTSNIPPLLNADQPSAERERIRSLERQLWNIRVVLGALVGALAGALFAAQLGSVLGLIVGGSMAAFGQRLPAALLGGAAGLLLGTSHLPTEGGGLAGLLLGALTGFLIAEVGSPSSHRK